MTYEASAAPTAPGADQTTSGHGAPESALRDSGRLRTDQSAPASRGADHQPGTATTGTAANGPAPYGSSTQTGPAQPGNRPLNSEVADVLADTAAPGVQTSQHTPVPRHRHPAPGELELVQVTYGPLRNLSLRAPVGRTTGIAVLEPDAAAALLDLLALRTRPTTGRLLLDGGPLGDLPSAEARGAVRVPDRHGALFDGTVAQNVAAVAAPFRASAALAAACAGEVTGVFPRGKESRVGEHGGALSSGQRQRVALAAALAADPPVLVLHEPVSAAATPAAAEIADRMQALRCGRTTVLVTTSPTLLQRCDEVALIASGTVQATGTHHELTRQQPAYRYAVLA